MTGHGFFLMLLVSSSMALWDSYSGIRNPNSHAHTRAVPTQCTQAGVFCSNCQESYFCQTSTSTPVSLPACNSNEVCGGPDPGSQGCRDFMADGVSAGACDCDTVDNNGYLADPYDDTRYFLCIPSGQQFLATCADGEVFSSDTNTCVEESVGPTGNVSNVDCTAEGVTIGFYTNDQTCQTYTLCFSNSLPGIPLSCPDGEAYDVSIPGCVSQCLLGPAAFTCPEGAQGAFPDTSDCTIFHVCSNGDLFVPDPVSCPDGQLFEPTSMLCVPSSTSVACPVINECWAAYCDACDGSCPDTTGTVPPNPDPNPDPNPNPDPTSTTTIPSSGSNDPPNCDNGPGYYAYTADCKQFWSCQDDDAGGYEAILYRCPGSLYFNPSSSNCNLQSSLPANPGCTLITA